MGGAPTSRRVRAGAESQTARLYAMRARYAGCEVTARAPCVVHYVLSNESFGIEALEKPWKKGFNAAVRTSTPDFLKMSKGKCFLSDCEPCDSSSQSSMISVQLRDMEDTPEHSVEYEKCSVFFCAHSKCNLVLGDSLGACGEVKSLKSIICLKISKDVRVRGKLEMYMEGPLKFCTYKGLECSGCRRFVGFVLHSTPHHLSSLRGLYLLLKEAVYCYMLKSCKIVNASNLCFEHRLLGRSISEMKQDLEAQLKQVNLLKDMLDDSRLGHGHLPLSSTVSD